MLATQGCTSTELEWLKQNTVVFSSPLRVKTGKLFNIMKTDRQAGWGVAMHPFLIRSPSGRIGLTYFTVGDTDNPQGFSEVNWPYYSDDLGKTWVHGDPFLAPGVPEDHSRLLHIGDTLPKKNLISMPYAGNIAIGTNFMITYDYISNFSNVVGRWTGPDGLWRDPEVVTINLPPAKYHRVMALQTGALATDGTIYLVAYHPNPVGTREGYHSIMLVSHDGGAHFDYLSTIAKPDDVIDSQEGPCEPTMTIMPDGEIIVIMRTGGHVPRKMLMARSKDSGKSWTLSDMPMIGVQPKLLQMFDGKVLALASGRPGNHLYFSTDGGLTWPRHEVIFDKMASTGYIDIMEVSPGRLLAVFDGFGSPDPTVTFGNPPPVNGIYGMFIDVDYTPPKE